MESATSEVSRLSIDPKSAMVSAGCTARANKSPEISGIWKSGRPVGTSPMTGVFSNHNTLSSVPTIRAISIAGMKALRRGGQKMHTPSEIAAMARELKFTSLNTSGQDRTASIGPPSSTSAPTNGRVCTKMMMTPMPDMNPDTTE